VQYHRFHHKFIYVLLTYLPYWTYLLTGVNSTSCFVCFTSILFFYASDYTLVSISVSPPYMVSLTSLTDGRKGTDCAVENEGSRVIGEFADGRGVQFWSCGRESRHNCHMAMRGGCCEVEPPSEHCSFMFQSFDSICRVAFMNEWIDC